jgi:hypothetical protein
MNIGILKDFIENLEAMEPEAPFHLVSRQFEESLGVGFGKRL